MISIRFWPVAALSAATLLGLAACSPAGAPYEPPPAPAPEAAPADDATSLAAPAAVEAIEEVHDHEEGHAGEAHVHGGGELAITREDDFLTVSLDAPLANFGLSEAKVPEGASPSEYYRLLKKAMIAWSQDELAHDLLDETWGQFEDRVHSMLTHLKSTDAKRVLVVSSGGAIAMMLKHILGYDSATVVNMNLQIRNASFSQCFANARGVHLNNFNSVPHLDVTDRLHAITYS